MYWIFTQTTELNSIYRRTFLCLDETSRVACNSGETQTRKLLIYFSVEIDSRTKSWQKCGKSRDTLKSWNAAISKYIRLIFYYVMEKLLIFNICKIWTGVMWSTLKRSSGAKLGHDKLDIPAFDTVLFHSNLSSLRQTFLSDVPTGTIVLSYGPKLSKRPLKRRYWWLKNKERKCHFRFGCPSNTELNSKLCC